MEARNGGKPNQSDATPLNLASARAFLEGKQPLKPSPHTIATDRLEAPTTTPGPDDTLIVKPDPQRLYEIPAIQRLLQPRPKIQPQPAPPPAPAPSTPPAPLIKHTGSLTDRKAAYRRWLEGRSKEDLIEMIVGLENREALNEATHKMTKTQADEAGGAALARREVPADLSFMRLPVVRKTGVNDLSPTWRVALLTLDQHSRFVGLEIDGEITIGRKTPDTSPDLDLTPYGAQNSGVSRFHACLRPSNHDLMLIDNDSSNGTYLNQRRLTTQT